LLFLKTPGYLPPSPNSKFGAFFCQNKLFKF
jgi:hypothetical protein